MLQDNDTMGGNLCDAPNQKYQDFFAHFEEIKSLPIVEWKPVHLIAYFCEYYYRTYQIKFKFKFNSSTPSKSFEVFQIKKLASLLSSQPDKLKDYLDWIFINKVPLLKRRFTSISLLNNDIFLLEYKNQILNGYSGSIVSRNTILSPKYCDLLKVAGFRVNTLGDLAFLYAVSPPPAGLLEALNNLQLAGFDTNLLNKVI